MELGYIVRAEREYAAPPIKLMRFGMGAREMASGRKPSMESISTRRARGVGVGVRVSVGIIVEVDVIAIVGVTVSVVVAEGVEAADHICIPLGNWQAKIDKKTKVKRKHLWRFIGPYIIKSEILLEF